jgi:hypothetical protein
MLVTVEVKKFKMPKGIATDINRNSQPEDAKKAQKKASSKK